MRLADQNLRSSDLILEGSSHQGEVGDGRSGRDSEISSRPTTPPISTTEIRSTLLLLPVGTIETTL
jgi:hypothetical protein